MSRNFAKPEVLIIYNYYSHTQMRQNTHDHLFSFADPQYGNIFFWNACFSLPTYLQKKQFDLIVFHVTFSCSLIWAGSSYSTIVAPIEIFRYSAARKVMLVQDEFYRTDQLCHFINDFDIWAIFSVAPSSEWNKIYREVDSSQRRFFTILTGYLIPDVSDTVAKFKQEQIARTIQIGYRAWKAEYWVGSHGYLKSSIADVIREGSVKRGISVDISTKPEDTFYGLDWYRFQLKCKYMIGVEGGSSLLDYNGMIQKKINAYLKQHPRASFSECEKNCFPGLDYNLRLFAISPRHLEACATKTCQILIEGHYNGILKPWKHYIPLKKDFSNLDEVLDLVQNDNLRQTIVDNAYRDIVLSGLYTYERFVQETYARCFQDLPFVTSTLDFSKKTIFSDFVMRSVEKGSRYLVPYLARFRAWYKADYFKS